MKIRTIAIPGILLCLCIEGIAQTPVPKRLPAKRTEAVIKIDGNLDEAVWKDAPVAKDFVEFRPVPFRKEDPANRTEVFFLYDNQGIYVGGYCHERSKDSISTELRGRDGFGNNDFISIDFDTYGDKINGFEYFTTPLGEQMDAKIAPSQHGNEDFSWNAVWKSAAVIHEDGWTFEMFIPFSAIRFSKKNIQDWGMNLTRRRQKLQQQVAWNPIDQNINGFLTQNGYWTGLENIKPPLRLQFSPYFSVYANHYPTNIPGVRNWNSEVNGGMDVKYGISQAITLDMTLIPDFGQVKSDNTVLNLSPFEVKYNENRAFFTEGTELFNKGNLFYSRRVGGRPLHFDDVYNNLAPNEIVVSNPQETRLANATKISGRLKSGLGIGIFNAVTTPTHAIVEDQNKVRRNISTSTLTNYNIIVLDQTLKNNSSVSFINTSVWRSGKDYDADVSAVLFDLNDKSNTWNVGGKVSTSNLLNYLPGGKTKTGYSHSVYFGKTSGKFNFNINQNLTTSDYTVNDMGYFTFGNFIEHYAYAGFHWNKPSKWYNSMNLNFNFDYTRRLTPSMYQNVNINMNANGQLKNLSYAGALFGYEPAPNDFYEPHVPGRYFKGWSDWFIDGWIETNSAKKYQVYTEWLYVHRSFFKSRKYQINLNQRYRFSDKLSISFGVRLEPQRDNLGFAAIDNNDIIFGKRNISLVENTLGVKYNFNRKMGFRMDLRHYWSKVDYRDPSENFFKLLLDGSLEHITTFSGNVNQNYNAFNIDAVYTWEFAPGSFLNIVWKNANEDFNRVTTEGYVDNLHNTLNDAHNNSISLKILYFLDYLQLKGHKKK